MDKQHLFLVCLLCSVGAFFSTLKVSAHGIEHKQSNTQNEIVITNAYARETIPGTNLSSMYMTIANNAEIPVSLIGVSSDISGRIEIHQHTMADGIMKMGKVDNIIIKAGDKVTLAPYGFHLMVFDLDAPLKAQQSATITLHFEDQINVQVPVPVVSIKKQQ